MQCPFAWSWMRLLMVMPIVVFSVGCDIPAQIEWSPDGSSAAYFNGNQAMLLDEQGKIAAQLGQSAGGFAWSADSKHLYFAADLVQTPTTRSSSPSANSTSRPATTQSSDGSVIYDLHDGSAVEMIRLPGQHVVHMRLSPKGQWLAMAGLTGGKPQRPHATITVLELATHRSSVVSTLAVGMTFVTKDILAFGEITAGEITAGEITAGETTAGDNTESSDHGLISEVKLDHEMGPFKRRDLIEIIPSRFGWMQACDGDILFTQQPLASPQPIDHAAPHGNLYRFNRANSGLACVAEDVGELFAVSPNGKKILFEKDIWPEAGSSGQEASVGGNRPATKPIPAPTTLPATTAATPVATALAIAPVQRRELSVMNANGSDPHTLRVMASAATDGPMLPAWHGDDAITDVNPVPLPLASGERRTRFQILDYRLSERGQLQPIRTLSDGWPKELLPSVAVDQH